MAPVPFRCPRCGAAVQAVPHQPQVTCTYCGTTTPLVAQVPGYAAPPGYAPAAPATSAQKSGFPLGAAIGAAALLIVLVAGAGVALVALNPKSGVATISGAKGSATSTGIFGTPAAKAAEEEEKPDPPRLENRRGPLLADLNGDGGADFVAQASVRVRKKGMTRIYMAFDGKTGSELWRTDDLGNDSLNSDAALEHGMLLLTAGNGTFSGFDGRTGKQKWSVPLSERVLGLCRASEPQSVRVMLADKSIVAVAVGDGARTPVAGKPKCERANTNIRDPFSDYGRDRSDPSAPPDMKSVVCGGVTVMGDQNFTLPEQCKAQAKIAPELDGMKARALWFYDGGHLVLGYRTPGTRVPRVGLLKGGKFVWSSDVPVGNPLEFREGAPGLVAFASDRLYVVYQPQGGGKADSVTAFDPKSGKRLWNSELPAKFHVNNVKATPTTVILSTSDNFVGLSGDSGKLVFQIGDGD